MADGSGSGGRETGLGPELAALVLVAAVYGALATYGTFEWLGEEKLSRAYDYLGESFLRLEATVPTNAESLRVDGEDYVYFGPLPALVRIPLNAVWSEASGLWGRISTLVGGLAALGAWLWLIRGLVDGAAVRVVLGLAFGLGTPVAFLVSAPFIWHESMVIALAGSLWALALWIETLVHRRMGRGVWLGLGCAIAVAYLTRLTFSVPHLAILTGLYGLALIRGSGFRALYDAKLSQALLGRANAACLLLPLIAAFAFQGWYNAERFGSPWVYTSHSSLLSYALYPELQAQHDAVGTFNLARVPGNFGSYLGWQGRLDTSPPFAHLAPNDGLDDALYLEGYREWNGSLWFVSGWLVLGAGAGLAALARQRKRLELCFALAFSGQLGVVLTYYWVSQRFAAELLPLLCWGFAFGVMALRDSPRWRTAMAVGIALAIPITLASTLSWQAAFNWGAPDEYRAALRAWFGS